MIIVEFGLLNGLTQLTHVKTIDKMQKVGKPIKINVNIAEALVEKGYIRPVEKGFYKLTKKGESEKPQIAKIQYTLDNFLKIKNITAVALKILKVESLPSKNLIKVYDMCCHSCGTVIFGPPFYVEDNEGNRGNYCENCIKDNGYELSAKKARSKHECR